MKNLITYIIAFLLVCSIQDILSQSSLDSDSIQDYIKKAEKLQKEYKYEQSLEIAKIALQNAQYNDDSESQGYIYSIIAKNYEINDENSKAIKNYLKALTYSQISKSKGLEIDLYNNLARLYVKHEHYRTKGIEYFDKSYKYAFRVGDTTRMIKPLLNLSEYYISEDDYVSAYKYLFPAKKLVTKYSSNLDKTRLNGLLGKYFISNNRFDKANEYVNQAISYAQKETKNKINSNLLVSTYYDELASAYKTQSVLYYHQKEYKLAYDHQDEYHKNLLKAHDIKKLIELQRANIKYEVQRYEEEIKEAEFDKVQRASEAIKWRISIGLGVVVFVISLAFLYSSARNNRQKRKLNYDLIQKNKELVSAKETAEQVSTLKSQFISTVSHELRTPLYGVIGLTSLLMENPDEKKKNEYLESLKFSGDYLLALINDVLQLSKIETNEVTLEKVSFDLRTLIEGIVNSLRSKQTHNNNEIHIDIDKRINTTLLGDSVRLSQILINLIGNALKFTKDGNIWIKVNCLYVNEDVYRLRFVVKDDGIGIPKNKQQTIFDNFVQAKSQNQEFEGTGLGLSIVKKLIQLHDSEIHFISEEDKGSEFYFDLTYDKAMKEQEISLKTGETISIGTTNFNILVVDDNKINQIVTQNILKKKGYTCDASSNGKDAIQKIKEGNYDLVLMDINMPEMNGLDATTVIRTFNSLIPIIALTAVEEGEIRDQALSVGMNDVIIKPYDTQQFFQTIMRNISKVKFL